MKFIKHENILIGVMLILESNKHSRDGLYRHAYNRAIFYLGLPYGNYVGGTVSVILSVISNTYYEDKPVGALALIWCLVYFITHFIYDRYFTKKFPFNKVVEKLKTLDATEVEKFKKRSLWYSLGNGLIAYCILLPTFILI